LRLGRGGLICGSAAVVDSALHRTDIPSGCHLYFSARPPLQQIQL